MNKLTTIALNLTILFVFSFGLLQFIHQVLLLPVDISFWNTLWTTLILIVHSAIFVPLYKNNK